MIALEGVSHWWRIVGHRLFIPDATLSFIDREFESDMERLRRVVRYWILTDPFASWRRLIFGLYNSHIQGVIEVADGIKKNAEKVTGEQFFSPGCSIVFSPGQKSEFPDLFCQRKRHISGTVKPVLSDHAWAKKK